MIATASRKGEAKPKMTQKRAAELLDVTPWYLNRVLRGHLRSKRLSKAYAELLAKHTVQN